MDKPEPNAASRQMMNVLADLIGNKLTLEAARIEVLVETAKIALREGRFDDFMRDAFAISDSTVEITDQLMRSTKTHDAIHAADPPFAAYLDSVERNLIYQRELPKYEKLGMIELVSQYARHIAQCTKDGCPTARAYVNVMKARGIEPPQIEFLRGGRRE